MKRPWQTSPGNRLVLKQTDIQMRTERAYRLATHDLDPAPAVACIESAALHAHRVLTTVYVVQQAAVRG